MSDLHQDQVERILRELYESDPSLKQREQVLRQLVLELVRLKPETKFDEKFMADLRRRLMEMAETKGQKMSLIETFMKSFKFAGAAIALVALLAASAWYLNGVAGPSASFTTLLSEQKITNAGQNAFGRLASLQARGQGGGGGGSESSAPAPAPDAAMGSIGGQDMSYRIAPEDPVNFRYVYVGEELSLVQTQVDVLKRLKNEGNSLAGLLSRVSLGLVNLESFRNTQLQSFTFAEDRDLGYLVNVALNEGSVNIHENWLMWQRLVAPPCPVDAGGDAAICQPRRIDPEDVPADEVLLAAANQFLQEHGIPLGNYGSPFVNSDWRVYYERAEDKSAYWVPEVMDVVYPLIVNGQMVYDETGIPAGMHVSVRIAPEVRVSSVWDLTTQNYQSSAYEAETDVARIMALVERGGFRNYIYSDPSGRTVDVEVGTPEVSMVKLWNYKDGSNEELLVPALIFPITKQPEDAGSYYWHRRNIVIPLVREILDNEPGDVRIMPLENQASPAEDKPAEPATIR